MLVNRVALMIITFALMIILLIAKIHPVTAGIITFSIVMTGYLIISLMRSKSRLNLLDVNCDPQAFLERTEKQRTITGKNPKLNEYLNIDKAAGLITMGEFEKAKEILESINKNRLSSKNGTLLAYTINLILCLYELGDITHAEEIFETQIPVLPPVSPAMTLAVKMLVAERFFFLGRYNESQDHYNELLNQKISKRIRMDILYRLAQINEKSGDIQAAKEKFNEVASHGNKLWIADRSRQKLIEIL